MFSIEHIHLIWVFRLNFEVIYSYIFEILLKSKFYLNLYEYCCTKSCLIKKFTKVSLALTKTVSNKLSDLGSFLNILSIGNFFGNFLDAQVINQIYFYLWIIFILNLFLSYREFIIGIVIDVSWINTLVIPP